MEKPSRELKIKHKDNEEVQRNTHADRSRTSQSKEPIMIYAGKDILAFGLKR
jgi:hypothetical protein